MANTNQLSVLSNDCGVRRQLEVQLDGNRPRAHPDIYNVGERQLPIAGVALRRGPCRFLESDTHRDDALGTNNTRCP